MHFSLHTYDTITYLDIIIRDIIFNALVPLFDLI